MKFRLACLVLIVFAGCNGRNTEPTVQQESSEQISADKRLQAIRETDALNEQFSELTKQALELERDYRYAEAANKRQQILQLMATRLPEDSWQILNANLALVSAKTKAGFGPVKRKKDQQINTVHNSFRELLQTKDSDRLLDTGQQLVHLNSDLYGGNSVETARASVYLAHAQNEHKRYQDAVPLFHQAIEIFREHNFGDHPEVESAHAGLANAYLNRGRFTPAAANQKEAVRIASHIWGTNSLKFASQANQLGVIFHRAGKLDVAFEALQRAQQIREDQVGANDVAYAHSCLNLGALLIDLKRHDNAEVYLQKALNIFERDFGTEQSITNLTKSNLATIYMLRKQPELAEPLLSDIVKAIDDDSEQKLVYQYRLSVAYAKQGKYKLAKPMLETTYRRQKEIFGEADQRTMKTMRAYALLLERTHQNDDATTVKQQINRVARQTNNNEFQPRY